MHLSKVIISVKVVLLALTLALVGCQADTPVEGGAGGATATSTGGTGGTLSAGGTGGSAIGGAGGVSAGGSGPVVCDLGTIYPNRQLIDPDNPDYEESGWTKQQVIDAFADAKAQNNQAYRAYRAAFQYSEYMECPFCACGCAAPSLSNHLSAIDCFKDMHGFT
jgi:hypothetical protein